MEAFRQEEHCMELHKQHWIQDTDKVSTLEVPLERTDFYVRHGKRMLDIVVATVLLIVAASLMALIAIAIAFDSPGPIIFVQERIGKDGKTFKLYKFRTMYASNDDMIHQRHIHQLIDGNEAPKAGESLKLKNDPRITRLGGFLRRYSLDELPQFVNVLEGNMSVVGPRPEVAYAVAAYKPFYHLRFRAMPGITGYWQVEARNQVSYEQMIQM